MQKKLIALAVASLVSGGAFAQASNVTVYGRANLALDTYAATGSFAGTAADFQSRTRIVDSASRIGFKGTEDLGNGLQMNWQCESQVNMNQGGTATMNGTTTNASDGLCGRQSYAGLSGGWGEFRLGRQEVYWTSGRVNDVGANELVTGSPLSSTGGGLVAAPYNRTSNVLSYFTPTVSGFQGAAFYVAGAEAAAAGTQTNGKGYSLQLNYNNGPIAVKYDFAKQYVQNTAGLSDPLTGVPTNTGSKLALAYFYQGESKVGIVLAHLTMANIASSAAATNGTVTIGGSTAFLNAGNTLTQNTWDINWEHYWSDQFKTIVEFGQAPNASLAAGGGVLTGNATNFNAAETGVKSYTVAGKYFFSKRTAMYLLNEKITNGQQNWADVTAAGYSGATGNAAAGGMASGQRGADVKVTAIGLIHNF